MPILTEMLSEMDVDWTTMKCPCGAEICGETESYETMTAFMKEHKPHTNGMVKSYPISERAAKYISDTTIAPIP